MRLESGFAWLSEHAQGWQFGEAGVLAALGHALIDGAPGVAMEVGVGCPFSTGLSCQGLFDARWKLILADCNYTICQAWAHKLASDRVVCALARIRHTAPRPEHMAKLSGFGEPDILTIDVDSDDYYIWKATQLSPPIVMVEHRDGDGCDWPDAPYPWEGSDLPGAPSVFQANRHAMLELAEEKGYTLAASTRINGIYIRSDIVEKLRR